MIKQTTDHLELEMSLLGRALANQFWRNSLTKLDKSGKMPIDPLSRVGNLISTQETRLPDLFDPEGKLLEQNSLSLSQQFLLTKIGALITVGQWRVAAFNLIQLVDEAVDAHRNLCPDDAPWQREAELSYFIDNLILNRIKRETGIPEYFKDHASKAMHSRLAQHIRHFKNHMSSPSLPFPQHTNKLAQPLAPAA